MNEKVNERKLNKSWRNLRDGIERWGESECEDVNDWKIKWKKIEKQNLKKLSEKKDEKIKMNEWKSKWKKIGKQNMKKLSKWNWKMRRKWLRRNEWKRKRGKVNSKTWVEKKEMMKEIWNGKIKGKWIRGNKWRKEGKSKWEK